MPSSPIDLAAELVWLVLPLSYALGALLQALAGPGGEARRWRLTGAAAALGLAAALAGLALRAAGASGGTGLLRLDTLSLAVATLIAFIALIILRYSREYLAGDPGQGRYQTWFLATLASVATLVLADHMALFFAGWVLTSLCLHRLLVYYPRKRAVLAAHKKFLISRAADLALLGALLLVIEHSQTLSLGAALAALASAPPGPGLSLAAVLLVLAAAFKCAQLPVHGWLLQVMEAPTPVSALLHAGIVNMGGFLMILFAPLIGQVPAAQWLLVLIGGTTAILASLVMLTRISVKVMLAWSTCAQMGFMLLECGLGAYELALLHLLGHSLYKAYRFLDAGESVNQHLARGLAAAPAPLHPLVPAAVGAAALGALGLLAAVHPLPPGQWAMAAILALAGAAWLVQGWRARRAGNRLLLSLAAGALLGLYLLWHQLLAGAVAVPASVPAALAGTAVAAFLVLYALYWTVELRPRGRLARRLYPACYAGLYLDEWLTHATLRWWPTPLPQRRPAAGATTRTAQQEG